MRLRFADGIINIVNKLANHRAAQSTNVITANKIDDSQLRAIYRTGLGSKIVRIKTGYALNDTLQFECDGDEQIYRKRLERAVKKASKFMLGFGRGIILLNERGADLSKPMTGKLDPAKVKLDVFSGDMVSVTGVSIDLTDERYQKPRHYVVRGKSFHWTRVIDFTYYLPTELDLPTYNYGGISEFEMIHTQLINDGIVERASGTILEKNSTLFHKVKGFKEAIRCKEDDHLIEYYAKVAELRSIYGDGLIDADDDVVTVDQSLTNLDSVDNITIRRLALVTSIPVPLLVGESVQGLNSAGHQERQSFQDMIEGLQYDYMADPICDLCAKFGIEGVQFKDNQGGTALERVEFETKVIDNALKLDGLGEDYRSYLTGHAVIKADSWSDTFAPPAADDRVNDESDDEVIVPGAAASDVTVAQASMNGAQIASLVEVLNGVAAKTMPTETAKEIIASAFPLSAETIDRMIAPMLAVEVPTEPEGGSQ